MCLANAVANDGERWPTKPAQPLSPTKIKPTSRPRTHPPTHPSQAKSADLASVSMYYSNDLVAFVRRVLEVIPENVFRILSELINMQANEMTPVSE